MSDFAAPITSDYIRQLVPYCDNEAFANALTKAADHIAALEAALKTVSGYTGRLEFKLKAEQEKVQMLREALDEISAKALQATAPEQAAAMSEGQEG